MLNDKVKSILALYCSSKNRPELYITTVHLHISQNTKKPAIYANINGRLLALVKAVSS